MCAHFCHLIISAVSSVLYFTFSFADCTSQVFYVRTAIFYRTVCHSARQRAGRRGTGAAAVRDEDFNLFSVAELCMDFLIYGRNCCQFLLADFPT